VTAQNTKQRNRKLIIVLFAVIFIITLYFIIKLFGPQFVDLIRLLERGDQNEIGAYLNSRGRLSGMLAVYLISILQVVSIFIPGMAIQVAAGLIYGWWKAFLCCYLGFVSGNLLVFLVARRLGSTINGMITGSAKAGRLSEKINGANAAFVIGLACLVPGVPNGIVPYVAATTDLSNRKFGLSIAASCWIQILSNCIAGHFLIRGEYFFMILSIAVQILLIVLVATHRDTVMRVYAKLRRWYYVHTNR